MIKTFLLIILSVSFVRSVMLSRVLCGLFLIIFVSEDFILCGKKICINRQSFLQTYLCLLEPCIIEATGEVGECIPFQQCRSLVDAYKLDRSTALTVCNREMRAVCCPANFMPKPVIDPTSTTTEPSIEQDSNADESFIASQIIKSLYIKVVISCFATKSFQSAKSSRIL